jgi:uncharacterized membrane-anchored protein YhcB (DUF1043 family)
MNSHHQAPQPHTLPRSSRDFSRQVLLVDKPHDTHNFDTVITKFAVEENCMAETDTNRFPADKTPALNESEDISALKQQLEQKTKELELSKLETNALKFVNAKLLTQLQHERQQISEHKSLSSTPLATFASSMGTTQPTSSKKKKGKKNSTSDNLTSSQENNESPSPEEKIINSTVQELMIHLQMENQKLSSDILVLEEEVGDSSDLSIISVLVGLQINK